jgi:sec-independent protein translocase protein TatC
MTLREHLEELRSRLLICVLTVGGATIFSFFIAEDWLFPLLEGPAPDEVKFLVTEPTGVFGPYIRVSLTSGAILAMPVIVWQLVLFVSPALKSSEKRYLYLLLPLALVAFGSGVTFSYFVLLPPALDFLLTFGEDIAEVRPVLDKYVNLVTTLMFWIGLIFETPVIIYFLARVGVVNSSSLVKQWRLAVLGAFLLGALITPTVDPVNQTLVAAPLVVLYLVGIGLAKVAEWQRRRSEAPVMPSGQPRFHRG